MNNIIVFAEQPSKSFWGKNKQKFKWGLVIAGTTVAGVLLYKHREAITNYYGGLFVRPKEEMVAKSVAIPHTKIVEVETMRKVDVPMHLRDLPKGQKASAMKLERAEKLGMILSKNQTWVEEYSYEKSIEKR